MPDVLIIATVAPRSVRDADVALGVDVGHVDLAQVRLHEPPGPSLPPTWLSHQRDIRDVRLMTPFPASSLKPFPLALRCGNVIIALTPIDPGSIDPPSAGPVVGGRRVEQRRLGRLEHRSSVLIYGAASLGDVPQTVADRSIQLALDAGINHFDTAAGYGDSELRLGAWMPRIRDQIFLASKTGERTATGAYDSIRASLDRLATDRLDLIQLHAVGDLDDLTRALGSSGAIEGAIRARDEGLVDAIGITGHGMGAPSVHREALRLFPFDTVLTPCNYRLCLEPGFLRDLEALEDEIRANDAGLMFIKAIARNLWRVDEVPRYSTWYEPLDSKAPIDAAVAFALRRDAVTGIATAGDVRLLPMLVEAERRRSEVSDESIAATLGRVPELEPPFMRLPGRAMPDWLEPVATDP